MVMMMLLLSLVVAEPTDPPACLIGAMSAFPNPADVKSICGKYQQEVTSKIAELCTDTDGHSAALKTYANTCYSEAQIRVALGNSTTPKVNPTSNTGIPTPFTTSGPDSVSSKPKSPSSSIVKSPSPVPTTSVSGASLSYPFSAFTVWITGIILRNLL